MLFTGSKNIVPSQSYRIFKSWNRLLAKNWSKNFADNFQKLIFRLERPISKFSSINYLSFNPNNITTKFKRSISKFVGFLNSKKFHLEIVHIWRNQQGGGRWLENDYATCYCNKYNYCKKWLRGGLKLARNWLRNMWIVAYVLYYGKSRFKVRALRQGTIFFDTLKIIW